LCEVYDLIVMKKRIAVSDLTLPFLFLFFNFQIIFSARNS
jgi:hypothetical protein